MSININDPRITQYALDEMPIDEIKSFENEIKDNKEILEEINDIKRFSDIMKDGLKNEPNLSLTESRKNVIEKSVAKPKNTTSQNKVFIKFILSAAAMVIICIIIFYGNLDEKNRKINIQSSHKVNKLPIQSNLSYAKKSKKKDIKSNITRIKDSSIANLEEKQQSMEVECIEVPELNKNNKVVDCEIADNSNLIAPKVTASHITNIDQVSLHVKNKNNKLLIARDKLEKVLIADPYNNKVINKLKHIYKKLRANIKNDRKHEALERTAEVQWKWSEAVLPTPLKSSSCGSMPIIAPQEVDKKFNTENYSRIVENNFKKVKDNPLSTFSIDVDTASYANVRRFINQGSLPQPDVVRIEELINYFNYEYPQPDGKKPFSVNFDIASCPWNENHKLVKIGLKGKEIKKENRAAVNLVFLLDVSGSMSDQNKLPLLKKSMKLLLNQLDKNDRVAIVVYAGASGIVLPSTTADNKEKILSSLNRLNAGGSTNGGAGIQLAYKTAIANYIEGGVNRVILATDGDFNVGISSEGDLEYLIEKSANSGVFLTVLGFGMGNYKDSNLEKLSGKGNGNYAYIDTLNEAKKVLVNEMGGTLITIAKDVKIQVEFNPELVAGYRLIGYENRMLNKEDFNDDKKDAGEIGAGHTVTVFYEIVPAGTKFPTTKVDALKYQKNKINNVTKSNFSNEIMTIKLRYKEPDGKVSKLIEFPLKDSNKKLASASDDFKFAAAIAEFGMLLRNSQYKGTATFESALELAKTGLRNDKYGYKKEFILLIKKAKKLKDISN